MGKIYIVGLGPGSIDDLTKGALDRIHSGDENYLRTEFHPTVEYFNQKNIAYRSLDNFYQEGEVFEDVYYRIAQELKEVSRDRDINYFVPGNPMVAEKTVEILIEDEDLDLELVSGLSFIEPVLELVGKDPVDGFQLLDGSQLRHWDLDISKDTIITQVYNPLLLSDIKLVLSEVYGDLHQAYFIQNAGIKGREIIHDLAIYELDRVEEPNLLTSLYIPKLEGPRYSFSNLLEIMDSLRSDDGCPWDREQSHESIRESVIEEAYELVYAINMGDMDNLIEELGDVLLQVIFHSQIAMEEGNFNIHDVITGLSSKLIYRHPHVFSNKTMAKSDEVVYNWDVLKYKKRQIETYSERLRDIKGLPSLLTSYKIQKEAAKVGFDWEDINGPMDKVKEEYAELIEAFEEASHEEVEEEVGDLLFSVVNLSRFMKVNPEIAINRTIDKFIKRFEFMEEKASEEGQKLEDMGIDRMETLWNEAKNNLED